MGVINSHPATIIYIFIITRQMWTIDQYKEHYTILTGETLSTQSVHKHTGLEFSYRELRSASIEALQQINREVIIRFLCHYNLGPGVRVKVFEGSPRNPKLIAEGSVADPTGSMPLAVPVVQDGSTDINFYHITKVRKIGSYTYNLDTTQIEWAKKKVINDGWTLKRVGEAINIDSAYLGTVLRRHPDYILYLEQLDTAKQERDEKILSLYSQGLRCKDIAKQLDICPGTVSKVLKDSKQEVKRYRNKKLTDEQIDEMVALIDAGMTKAEASRKFKVSQTWVGENYKKQKLNNPL